MFAEILKENFVLTCPKTCRRLWAGELLARGEASLTEEGVLRFSWQTLQRVLQREADA